MPVIIKAGNMKYKSEETGQYVGINSVSDNTTAEQIALIEAAAAEQITVVESAAEEKVEDAEAYAKGTRAGTNVDSSDPAYHNNAKYFSEQAHTAQIAAEAIVPSTAEEWLNSHITNPNSPPLDRSLLMSSAAAPADIVGNIDKGFSWIRDFAFDLDGYQPTTSIGGVTGSVGSAVSIGSSTSYRHWKLAVQPGEAYVAHINTSTSASYPYYIYYTDANETVVGVDCPMPETAGQYDVFTVVPDNAAYMYVMVKTSTAYVPYISKYIFSTKEKIDTIETDIGTVIYKVSGIDIGSVTDGGLNGVVGEAIQTTVSDNYCYTVVSVNQAEKYRVSVLTNTSSSYPNYIYFTDNNNIVINVAGQSPYTQKRMNYDVTVPEGTTKMYVMCRGSSASNIAIGSLEEYPLQQQILDMKDEDESEGYSLAENGLKIIPSLNRENAGVSFAFITDTHSNGMFLNADRTELITGMNSRMSNSVFRNVMKSGMVDFGVHCGDIISAYNITKEEYVKTIFEYMKGYDGFKAPVLMVKGNHECNHEDGWYQTADIISNNEYYAFAQRRDAEIKVTDKANPFGGYYYVDNDAYRIRFIVLNAYIDPVTNGIQAKFGEQQDAWLSDCALNFGNKEDANLWGIVVFVHPAASTTDTIKKIRYYSGPATVIALIHGHAHEDQYTNEHGYNNIGVTRAYAQANELGDNQCCVDVFTLIPSASRDNRNGIIYETRFGRGNSRTFSWGNTVSQIV